MSGIAAVGVRLTRFPMPARSWTALGVLLVAGVAFHPLVSRSDQDTLTTLFLYIAGAAAWNLVGGIAGQFSLAQSVFVGAGSYTTVMMMLKLGWSGTIALAAAAAMGMVLAVVMGCVLLRLRGAYFTIGSLAFALAALSWMTVWSFTGATEGLSAPLALAPAPAELFPIALGVAGVAIALSIAIYHSRYGLRLMAVRDDEEVADSLGVAPFASKLGILVASGTVTALVGGVLALQTISIEPFSTFSVKWTISFVVMAIVGGLGTVWGPVIGAALIYYGLTVQLQDLQALSSILSGALIIVLITFLPRGVLGGVSALVDRVRRRSAPGGGLATGSHRTTANHQETP